ncbi:MAG: hypothetical protein R3F61_06125 [Myxococcota bacterium]
MILALLLACEPVDTGPQFTPVTDWRGTKPEVLVAKAPRFTPETALAAARAEGVEPSDADPDLSGSWISIEPVDTRLLETRTLRQRLEPGVYNTVDTVYGYVDGSGVVECEITSIEVVDRHQLCRYAVKTRTSFAKAFVSSQMNGLRVSLTPDKLNERPCTPVVQVTAELVELGEVGDSIPQTRRPKPKPPER